MSKSTISTFELFQMFPDAESARAYLEAQRWPNGAACPVCDEAKRIYAKRGGFYRGIIYLTPDYSSGSYLLMQRAIPPQPRGGCYAR